MSTSTLRPESAAETQAMVCGAQSTGDRLLPAGRRTWPDAGGWTTHDGTVVSTSRFDAVHHYEPADLTLTAGAGVGLDRLARIVEPNGQWLPFDAPGCSAGTLGAVVASGASGPLRTRYGATRDNVLGLEVVTGDGRILRVGGRVVKNVAGYDLVRLLTGSRGSLGIVTRVSVRLFPRPEADETLLFGGTAGVAGGGAVGGAVGGAADAAVAMARIVCTSGVPIAAVELWEGIEGVAGGATVLAARLHGGPHEVDESRRRIVAALRTEPDATLRSGESRRFHAARIGWEDGAPLVARLTALPDRIGAAHAAARTVAAHLEPVTGDAAHAAHATDAAHAAGTVASAAAGPLTADALHGVVRVKGSCRDIDPAPLVESLTRARREMEALGGSLTLSQAPAEIAEQVGWTGGRRETARLTDRIKALFDPDSILAPRCP